MEQSKEIKEMLKGKCSLADLAEMIFGSQKAMFDISKEDLRKLTFYCSAFTDIYNPKMSENPTTKSLRKRIERRCQEIGLVDQENQEYKVMFRFMAFMTLMAQFKNHEQIKNREKTR